MNRKKLLTMLIKISVSALLFGWFFFTVDWHDIARSFSQIKLLDVVFAVSLIIITVVISVIKWRLLLKAQGFSLRWRDLWQVYWVGLFFNNFLPSSIGGDAMRVMIVGNKTRDMAGVTVSVVVERTLATLGIALLGLCALLFTGTSSPHLRILFLLLLFISIIVLWLLMRGKVPNFIKKRQKKITVFFNEFINHGGCFKKHPAVLIKVVFWSVIFQTANIGVNYFIFQGLGIDKINFFDAMYIIPAAMAIAMLPLGINGYGIREGAYITLLARFGVGRTDAFTASILFAFLISLCSLWGGIVWLIIKRKEGLLLFDKKCMENSRHDDMNRGDKFFSRPKFLGNQIKVKKF